MKREISDILKNFPPKNEETATILKSLRGRLGDKLERVKTFDSIILESPYRR